MAKEFKISTLRLKELEQELFYLKTTREKEVAEQIKEARSFGDLSENSEYDEAKNEQAKLYGRIAEVENILAHAVIIDENEDAEGKIGLGCTIKVLDMETEEEEVYAIVGSQEANPLECRISDDAEAVAAAKAVGVELADAAEKTWGNALYACFDQKVEEQLVQPTFITMYPVEVSPLTKRSPVDPRLTERFEFFICRAEMGNAYSELNDPIDQRERFMKQVEQRERGDDETEMLDEDFLTALEYGMPPTGGMGMGIDRAVMLFTGADTIRDVILFPTMKPLDLPKKDVAKAEAAPAAPAKEEVIDFSKVEIEPLFKDFVDFETFSKSDFRAVKVKSCEAVKKSKKLLKFVLDDGTGTDRVILSGIHEYYEPEELVGKTCVAITNLPPRPMMGIDSCGMLISAVHHEEGAEKLHLLMLDPHIPAGAKMY